MRTCNHTSWLSFHGNDQIMFRQASTLSDIFTSFDAPAKRFPSLAVVIGNAGNALPSTRKCTNLQDQEGLSLQLDPDTAFSDQPALFAHENFSRRTKLSPEPMPSVCHRHAMRELQWQVSSLAEAVDSLYCRLVRPFADIVCFFAAADDGIPQIADKLVPWLEQSNSRNRRPLLYPRLLVILAPSEKRTPTQVKMQLVQLLKQQLKSPVIDSFSMVSVYIRHGSDQTLRDRIKRETDLAKDFRARNHISLNAVHFDRLFRHACDHFARTGEAQFDMLAASRLHRPVPRGLHIHLADLLTNVDTYEDMTAFAAPFIARCHALDNYAWDVPYQ
ncbi:hypothetical protein PMIN01_12064 [Paraphaeosphaeria minitans]|uniref:Uncharacterized protein n=1 Tax=Paraphaeosphaeria minitans TaxID=565426 RepID=A0A9P6G6P8_9PLEO|nr:hypothetical protein PMIN01_12064 [Paraphaeosphaeria minitans]